MTRPKTTTHKVAELEGALLDMAFAKARGIPFRVIGGGDYPYNDKKTEVYFRVYREIGCPPYLSTGELGLRRMGVDADEWVPTYDFAITGPVIREIGADILRDKLFSADSPASFSSKFPGSDVVIHGPDHLTAFVRRYVFEKFGETVDLPSIDQ